VMINRSPRAPLYLLGTIFNALLFLAYPALAQQQQAGQQQSQQPAPQQPAANAPASAQSKPEEQTKEQKIQTQQEKTGTSNDRLFYALPNFLTVENAGQIPPLTTGGKFKVVARSSFDYVEFAWYAALSGISQAENSEAGYGQGAEGYLKRYGAVFADGTIENFMTSAIFPSLLHADPRYYRMGQGGFWHRTSYAVSRIFATRTDSGGEQFNYSEIFGSALSAGISTYSYHPESDRTLRNSLSVWGTQIVYDTLTIILKEFWPDIRRHLSKK
jgi:hypothetical protein